MNSKDNCDNWIELDPIERQCIFEDYEKDSNLNEEIVHEIENYNYD